MAKMTAHSKKKAQSAALQKNTEEANQPTSEKDTAFFAGTFNQHLTDGPSMEVGSLPEAECLTFRAHMGGDTLDAFAPLAQYTQRHYDGQTNPLLQVGTKVASLIMTGSGVVYQKIRVREEDFVPESAGLMNLKADDLTPQEKAELMAQTLRKSKKH